MGVMSETSQQQSLRYSSGFGNEHASEARPGALPVGRNSPQRPPLGLYAEQLSATSFSAPRAENRRSWLYRIRPSVIHPTFRPLEHGLLRSAPITESGPTPNRFRWNPLPIPEQPTDFVQGLTTMAATGNAEARDGAAYHVYTANRSMTDSVFANHDGELLIVPQLGGLTIATELGVLAVAPGEIAVVPRGVKFRIALADAAARGFVCENYGAHFRLPELGPIGANGLANSRDFLVPQAWFEQVEKPIELIVKHGGALWQSTMAHSPLDVVAWHGNCYPYKYDLSRFQSVGSISYDHPDPSIQTVLTSPSGIAGVANCELTVFPPRWLASEDTFRPPYFHRNIMCEFVCMLLGAHESHGAGFPPGACSMHNSLTAHGPDPKVFEAASRAQLKPERIEVGTFVLFETRMACRPTKFALNTSARKPDYDHTWDALPVRFST
jgi:homogentisate 1,2-dioxygenase